MKRISLSLLALVLGSAFLILTVLSLGAMAQDVDVTKGGNLYKAQCISCHKNNLAGQGKAELLKKFALYEKGSFNSGAKKTMKNLFLKMSQAEKNSLARYISTMK